jgi:ABC-2 type transport system ATP-binding protein
MDILTVKNVVKKYANHTALNNINISVPEKTIFGLLGPNGAGKTSLIRIINQITGPDAGEIHFNGEKLRSSHVDQIGYLPEERGLYKKMEVGEQSLYLAQLKGLSRKDALAKLKFWFRKFEMESWWNKKVEELSKGMQQKVQFVVTVLHEPRLLILDEPFSGFDPINANLIKTEILDLKAKGSTIIFSTHNMGSVEELCDHIALINKSEVILDGSVKQIKKQYKSNIYEISFEGNLVGFTNALWTSAELLDKKEEDGLSTVKVKLRGETTANQLLQSVLPVSQIHSFREIIPSMNDIFISKVNSENISGTQSSYTE